jgi:hypothetical protein
MTFITDSEIWLSYRPASLRSLVWWAGTTALCQSGTKNSATGPSYTFYFIGGKVSPFIIFCIIYVCSDMKEFPFLLQLVLRKRAVHSQPLFKVPHLFKPFNNIPTYTDMFFLKILRILRLRKDEI